MMNVGLGRPLKTEASTNWRESIRPSVVQRETISTYPGRGHKHRQIGKVVVTNDSCTSDVVRCETYNKDQNNCVKYNTHVQIEKDFVAETLIQLKGTLAGHERKLNS